MAVARFAEGRPMRIRTKALGVIALAVVISAAANLLILRAVVLPRFVALEQAAAERNMQRVVEALNSVIDNLDGVVNDYAKWDVTYNYARLQHIDYIDQNITPDGLERLRICLLGIYDEQNNHLVESFFDFETDELRPAGELAFSRIDPPGRLRTFSDLDAVVKGILLSRHGPIIVASRPILKTSGEGPIAGAFIFGRLFDQVTTHTLQQQTRVHFRVTVLDGSPVPANVQRRLQEIENGAKEIGTEHTGDGALQGYAVVRDIYGSPALMIEADFPRDISAIGEKALGVSILGMLLAGLLVMTATGLLLQWIVLGPLARLTSHVLEVARSGDISRRVGLDRADELGVLGREFDAMLESLAQARHRLLDQSYRSGIAEMASGVLHNIRNQLAPLVMQLGRLREQIAFPRDDKIDLALAELTGASVPDERKEKMARYIRMAVRASDERRGKTAEQMAELVDEFVRFKHVLHELDQFSRTETEETACSSLQDVVRETLCMLPTFPDVRAEVRVEGSLQAIPQVAARSFVLQHILHNLLVNAVEAIAARGHGHGNIRISACLTACDGRQFVELLLQDDGVGIAPAVLPEVFTRGFSTKHGERRGTGLHWSANCVAAMGGKITVKSKGVGHGATFKLMLPVAGVSTDAAA
jgi:sensor domain CHASE-containing protein